MKATPIAVAVVCTLCACASAPKIEYYTLGSESTGRADAVANIAVERFKTTEALGRSQIMILASPTRIDYYATDHWAGSLGELVQQKLAAEFGAPVEGRKNVVVSGKVAACEQVDGAGYIEARVRLEVVIRDAGVARYQEPLFEKTYQSRRRVDGSGTGGVVAELSRCVEDIAADIAVDISSL
ncbi:MAG: ABC-type transport auxiliary lipoprotein family protein [Acidobacteriota bacterium]